jgi:hypothetical protein
MHARYARFILTYTTFVFSGHKFCTYLELLLHCYRSRLDEILGLGSIGISDCTNLGFYMK